MAPAGGWKRENPKTQAANLTVRPTGFDSSKPASSKPGAVQWRVTRPGWRCAPYVRHAPQRLQVRGRTGRGSVGINTRRAGSGLGAPDATFEGRATSGLGVVSGLLVACRDCEGRLSFLCSLCSRSIPQAERCQHAAHHTVHRHGLILAGNKVTPVPAPSSSTRWGLTWLLQNHPRRRASNCLLILFWFGSSAAYLASTGVSRQRRLRITKTGYRCPLWMGQAPSCTEVLALRIVKRPFRTESARMICMGSRLSSAVPRPGGAHAAATAGGPPASMASTLPPGSRPGKRQETMSWLRLHSQSRLHSVSSGLDAPGFERCRWTARRESAA